MGFKKILSILIFFSVVGLFLCPSSFATDIETKKKQTRAKINHLKWLENVETNKLYKNQQKLRYYKTINLLNIFQSKISLYINFRMIFKQPLFQFVQGFHQQKI